LFPRMAAGLVRNKWSGDPVGFNPIGGRLAAPVIILVVAGLRGLHRFDAFVDSVHY